MDQVQLDYSAPLGAGNVAGLIAEIRRDGTAPIEFPGPDQFEDEAAEERALYVAEHDVLTQVSMLLAAQRLEAAAAAQGGELSNQSVIDTLFLPDGAATPPATEVSLADLATRHRDNGVVDVATFVEDLAARRQENEKTRNRPVLLLERGPRDGKAPGPFTPERITAGGAFALATQLHRLYAIHLAADTGQQKAVAAYYRSDVSASGDEATGALAYLRAAQRFADRSEKRTSDFAQVFHVAALYQSLVLAVRRLYEESSTFKDDPEIDTHIARRVDSVLARVADEHHVAVPGVVDGVVVNEEPYTFDIPEDRALAGR